MEEKEVKEQGSGFSFSFKDFGWLCLSKWYLFLISVVIFSAYAYYQLLKEPKVYSARAAVMIKDKGASSQPDIASVFKDMSAFDVYSNLNNEMVAMTSPVVTSEVAKRLGLDVEYTVKEQLHTQPLFGSNQPIIVSFPDKSENDRCGLIAKWNGDGSVTLAKFVEGGGDPEKTKNNESVDLKLTTGVADTIETPVGKVVVMPNPDFIANAGKKIDIVIKRVGVESAGAKIRSQLKTFVTDKYSTIVNLSYNADNSEMAAAVLESIIDVYRENWIEDRNQIARSTYDFINERLGVIEEELGDVDSDVSGFVARQEVTYGDMSYNRNANTQAQERIMSLNSDLRQANMVREQLRDMIDNYTILPNVSALANAGIDGKIGEFNNMVSTRNRLVENSSVDAPEVQRYDLRIRDIRSEILGTLDYYIRSLTNEIAESQRTMSQSAARLVQGHTQAPQIHSVQRQQKVKESLYLYLLQKREENQLSQAFAAYNCKVVTQPYSFGPVSPVPGAIYTKWFVIGLLLPALLLFLVDFFNSKVRGRKDLEVLTVPFVGEIPLVGKRKSRLMTMFSKRKTEDETSQVLVKKHSGNVVNEAFRVIRTNLEFMVPVGLSDARSIMITSANPGSGKTFISLNLASVLALKGKKVALIDLDLRKAALSQSCGEITKGVSGYIVGTMDREDIVVKNVLGMEGVDLYPVGPLPPNPAELLYSDRLDALFDYLKENYDYVIADCPPVEMVADAKIVNRLVSLTLFIIRAEVLERAMLKEVQRFYDEKRYGNMAVILNGTPDPTHSKLRRSNRFGYGYGYGYGYPRKKK